MEKANNTDKPLNSKGAAIFNKMLEDKQAWEEHLQKGGKLKDFKRLKTLR
ncbi:MAG: hypothetical protein V4649_08550 [Bacteroidota bacterium]